ncbi:hypothetical protein OGM84_11165 [Pediococcus acidilactici]
MNKEFNEFVRRSTPLINDHFAELMEKVEKHQPQLARMMAYSFNAGGKRVRPLILLAILEVLGEPINPGFASPHTIVCQNFVQFSKVYQRCVINVYVV